MVRSVAKHVRASGTEFWRIRRQFATPLLRRGCSAQGCGSNSKACTYLLDALGRLDEVAMVLSWS
jgi:hypothetical protein